MVTQFLDSAPMIDLGMASWYDACLMTHLVLSEIDCGTGTERSLQSLGSLLQ